MSSVSLINGHIDPDKSRMTDKEIIKALECCISDDCDNCPDTFGNCEHNAMRNALDLINRQQAKLEALTEDTLCLKDTLEENERLRAEIERLHSFETYKHCRAEAICSECGREVAYQIIDNKWRFENFCPHCGADMRKEGADNG